MLDLEGDFKTIRRESMEELHENALQAVTSSNC